MTGAWADERLTEIFQGPEADIPLTEAALLVASHRYPNLDVHHYLDLIGELGTALAAKVGSDSGPADRVAALNHYLIEELGFKPNAEDYYDPRNSYLNQVVERRTGIPITLSLVYMAVGGHLGLAFNGVCYPGHFLVKCELPDGLIVLDPFSQGQSLSVVDLQSRLRDTRGGEVSRAIVAGLLVAAGKREILLRMLRNLKAIYLRSNDLDNALAIMGWIVVANPTQAMEVRDRGMVYQKLECFRAAMSDFERYLELDPNCSDSGDIRRRLTELQRSVSLLN
jgi:regulator of sirC expression with transglutaminase-like and TPR domain